MPLGVLAHYKAIIWYTGNDLVRASPGQPGGTGNSKLAGRRGASPSATTSTTAARVLVTGQQALQGAWVQFLYNPLGDAAEPVLRVEPDAGRATRTTRRARTQLHHRLQRLHPVLPGRLARRSRCDGDTLDARGARLAWACRSTAFTLNGADSADNQDHARRSLTTSSLLPADEFPQFTSDAAIRFDRPPAFDPPTGTQYVSTQHPATRATSGCAARST